MGIKNAKYAISKRRSPLTHVLVPFFGFRGSQVSKTVERSVFEGFKTTTKTQFSRLGDHITNLLSKILKSKKLAYNVKHNEHMQFYTTDGGHSFTLIGL